jgi:hypothetical protein
MRPCLPFFAILLLAGCSANSEKRVAREAAAAMTGSPETLTAVYSLTLEGHGTGSDAEGTFTIASYIRSTSYRRSQWRQEQIRVTTSASATEVRRGGFDGKGAYDENPDGGIVRRPEQEARRRRTEIYHHPVGLLLAVFANAATLSNTRTEGALTAVDITLGGVIYSLYIDAATKLPAKIVSKEAGELMETSFSQYVTLHGYKLPTRIVTKRDGQVTSDLTITRQFAGPDLGNLGAPGA